jgi:hypothetical protein
MSSVSPVGGDPVKNVLADQTAVVRGLIGVVLTRWNDERSLIPLLPGMTTPPAILISDQSDPCSASGGEFHATIAHVSDLVHQLRDTGDPQYQEAIASGHSWITWLKVTQALCGTI